MPSTGEHADKELVEKLAKSVRQSPFFSKRAEANNNSSLLSLFAKNFPEQVSDEEIRSALGWRGTITGAVKRFRTQLEETFRYDRSLWEGQRVISVPEQQPWRLKLDFLSSVLPNTWKFWFPQMNNLGPQKQQPVEPADAAAAEQREAQNHLIIFSEPLFFFSRKMRAYIRLLDVNEEGRIDANVHKQLVDLAEQRIKERVPSLYSKFKALKLVPVRHYLPAGDAYAANKVRGWFRSTMAKMGNSSGAAPEYREASQVAPSDYQKNLVILGSRCSLTVFSDFQKDNPDLYFELTEDGIARKEGPDLKDEIGDEGFRVAYAIVTMWTSNLDHHVHTYVISNHTRATSAVVNVLLGEESKEGELKKIAAGISKDGRIANRFQLAFRVSLGPHDVQAVPELIDEIKTY